MKTIYGGLFIARFRDVDPLIRSESIKALGSWMLALPSVFLRDYFLKYLGMSIFPFIC